MSRILDAFLKRIAGTDNIKELTSDEQALAKVWERELTKKPVTIDDLKKLLQQQIGLTTDELAQYDNTKEKDLFLKVYVRLCRFMLGQITLPERIKKGREADLEARLKAEKSK